LRFTDAVAKVFRLPNRGTVCEETGKNVYALVATGTLNPLDASTGMSSLNERENEFLKSFRVEFFEPLT
jgi:hypothetical protein